ncbi:ATP-binding protein [Tianweitania sediminis]|uniref:ATP-binding protein n=1 Tax=Tianweitania sediminis TaxID=1502156 RepID=UPI0036162FEC
MDKIIQPFFTTKSGPHNGLGLTAVSQMVQALGGSFSITSKPGNGTVASILFPI